MRGRFRISGDLLPRRTFSKAFPNYERMWKDLGYTGKGDTGVNFILTDPQGLRLSSRRLLNWRAGKGLISPSEEIEFRRIHAIREQLRYVLGPVGNKKRSEKTRKTNIRRLYRGWDVQGDWRKENNARSNKTAASTDIVEALVALGSDPHAPETYVTAYYG